MNLETRKPGKEKSAFPVYAKDDGMTLRDYFAAASLPVMIGRGDLTHEGMAEHAYKMADAMMREREKP